MQSRGPLHIRHSTVSRVSLHAFNLSVSVLILLYAGLNGTRKISNCDYSDQYRNVNCDYFQLIKLQACICGLRSIKQDKTVYQASS